MDGYHVAKFDEEKLGELSGDSLTMQHFVLQDVVGLDDPCEVQIFYTGDERPSEEATNQTLEMLHRMIAEMKA
ncbi:hypothetical protein ACFYOK_04670 [Microbispora bryophytorum]|uniref:hypothetical protein n=1 Tax=Microbispora bryophytorum TaxID=1460882 RepID=UPI0034006284